MALKEQDILNTLRQLSPEHQEEVADFIQELLEEQKEAARQPKQHNWREAAGLIKPQGPIPPEEVEQWIPEAMRRKHDE